VTARLVGLVPLAVIAGILASPGQAETVYVTDELRLGLYETEQTNGRAFKMLTSGDSLEVLERALMTIRVRTEAGEEGWVKTAYIVTEEPGRRRAAALESHVGELETQISERTAELDAAQSRVSNLETSLSEANGNIAELPALKAANADLEAELSKVDSRVPALWAIIAAAIALLAGFAAGFFWLDRRVRRQFGGVRVY
jgi:SH3 domain protein